MCKGKKVAPDCESECPEFVTGSPIFGWHRAQSDKVSLAAALGELLHLFETLAYSSVLDTTCNTPSLALGKHATCLTNVARDRASIVMSLSAQHARASTQTAAPGRRREGSPSRIVHAAPLRVRPQTALQPLEL